MSANSFFLTVERKASPRPLRAQKHCSCPSHRSNSPINLDVVIYSCDLIVVSINDLIARIPYSLYQSKDDDLHHRQKADGSLRLKFFKTTSNADMRSLATKSRVVSSILKRSRILPEAYFLSLPCKSIVTTAFEASWSRRSRGV